MKKHDIEDMSLRIETIWREAESRILSDIVRRIKKTDRITSTADYQINRLVSMGRTTEEIERELLRALNMTYPEMYELYDEVANWQYVRNEDLYLQINSNFVPPEENEQLKQISAAVKKQTADELANFAQSYGFSILVNGKKVFTPFATYYQQYIDTAIQDILDGSRDYNSVIRNVVSQMTNSGLRRVDYASGHSNRVPVAVRRAVLTGVAQITGKIAEMNAAELGTDYYEVDWHAGARPEHRVWQGKVYSHDELISKCGLGTVTGLHGANCYHDYYPFIPGISERLYSDEWLEEQNRKEAQTKNWRGKEYDLYGQTQKQRQMETAMRAQREKVKLLKEAGTSEDEVLLQKVKYQTQLNEYSRFSRKMGLEQQRERIYYDMKGRIAPRDKKAMQLFPPEMVRNANRDIRQYNAYKEILGKDAGSLIGFGQIKYYDEERWEFMKVDYRRRKKLRDDRSLKLPNAENAVLPEGKFTKYLLGGENRIGLAKGDAFKGRLGYTIDNWKELQKEIKEAAKKYPAAAKEKTEYGQKYEQKIILYGKKGTPANVIVGWIQKEDGTVSMTSAYIKEVTRNNGD